MAEWGPSRLGLVVDGPVTNAQSELHAIPAPSKAGQDQGKLLHPSNPLLAFGIIAAATFGFMYMGTSVRIGNAKASVSVGKP